MCNLCTYKTTLKANFQLHCKTDKHIQRLQLVNHIKEGGNENEWRLQYLNVSNPVQVCCNCCDYYTNSIHKLQMHCVHHQHERGAQIFHYLHGEDLKLNPDASKYYQCTVCNVNLKTKLRLILHVHSMAHLQAEGLAKVQSLEAGTTWDDRLEVFVVKEMVDEDSIQFEDDGEQDVPDKSLVLEDGHDAWDGKLRSELIASSASTTEPSATVSTPTSSSSLAPVHDAGEPVAHVCPFCTYSTHSESILQAHVVVQHRGNVVLCPLCQDEFKVKDKLERHLMQAHNVTAEGLQRLMLLVEAKQWAPQTGPPSSSAEKQPEVDDTKEINVEAMESDHSKLIAEALDISSLVDKDKGDGDNQYRCQTCSKTFAIIDQLYAHQNELGHLELKQTPRGPGYLCWKKGCNQYFKTAQALQVHFREIHAKRQASSSDVSQFCHQCSQCTLAFTSADKLQLHSHFHLLLVVTNCSTCTQTFHSIASHRKHLESDHPELPKSEIGKLVETLNTNAKAWHEGEEPKLKSSSSLGAVIPQISKLVNSCSSISSSPASDDRDIPDDMMEDEDNDLDMSGDDDSPTDFETSAMLQNSAKNGDNKMDEDAASAYRDQQFMEDFINSQAMAEGSYEDPARKYKCHRCKVAFTKQNYLTAHNKTLQHRRGDKINYPIERYLDPNRPFKCDVCKESFTQKNILLVHYNSVSHLHKLKQAAQTGNLPPSISSSSPTMSITASTPALNAVSTPDPEKKAYRCNICKVSYSQGSTLDIHIRSVGHQTRASKIHELAMTGQIDINQPLIEQPDIGKASSQLFPELHNPSAIQQSLLFSGLAPGLGQLPLLPLALSSSLLKHPSSHSPKTSSSILDFSPHRINGEMLERVVEKLARSSEEKRSEMKVEIKKEPVEQVRQKSEVSLKHIQAKLEMDSPSQPSYFCQRCSSSFVSHDALNTHQQIYCFLGAGANTLPYNRSRFMNRCKPHVHRNLLENIGFECVMQFNEYNQSKSVKVEKDTSDKKESKDESQTVAVANDGLPVVKKEEEEIVKKVSDLPEINKSSCLKCGKDFSSVWVLKAHQEEIHKSMVPIKAVEDFGLKFKTDLDKKHPIEEAITLQTVSSATSVSAISEKPEMPPPPPPPPVSLAGPFDMSQVMPSMFGMMPMPMPVNMMLGMHPPLMSMMMPSGIDMSVLGPQVTMIDPNFMSSQQQLQLQQAQNQKRVRTRISDEQLKILRGYFDINNSPSEEQIQSMSEQSGLPSKVIKHWFRNTLFKERQRNKDSPYNFNNPPSTSLDLEEYEKTGKIPEIKTETNDDYEDDDQRSVEQESDHEHEKMERLERLERYENMFKLDTSKIDYHDDKKDLDSYSNASTPSTTSSIQSTPAVSISNTPTPNSSIIMDDMTYMREGSSGKRANRTRFTDFQIKLLQEYFDQNAYPKDDELEHLSKILNLSPRVIVVWFQNARQKARKIYENQPAVDTKEGNSPFQRTPGLNYQCKKCNAVFQRYYELIKHQKRPCITENNNTMSTFDDDDSNSTTMSQDDLSPSGSTNELKQPQQSHQQSQQLQLDLSPTQEPLVAAPSSKASESTNQTAATFTCDKCDASFNRLDLWQEHLKIHTMNPTLFDEFPQNSAFGMLQNLAHQEDNKAAAAAAAAKRKLSIIDTDDERDDQPRDKRLRTTILPEQLDYLYQKYQLDCNPSRKQLEAIASDVGLKKRVVQVWFQNTRARERKGQYRAHQQLIHKRCPFCRALFRAKSALESHLATKHAEEMAKVEINVDSLPDASMECSPTSPQPPFPTPTSSLSGSRGSDLNKLLSLSPAGMQQLLPFMSPSSLGMGFPSATDPLQISMNKIYEDSFKKYINEISTPSNVNHVPKSRHSSETSSSRRSETEGRIPAQSEDDSPLDLSKPIKVNTETDKGSDGPLTDASERSEDPLLASRRFSMDDSISETCSEFDNSMLDENNMHVGSPSSPSGYHMGQINKRYRTQMTSLQVKVMKTLFLDYKTPTMAECELLGREIGLPKRVVQVWFQNARAKEKKCKLTYSKTFGGEADQSKPPDECTLCNFKYSHKFTIQDHIFTRKHIDNAKVFIQAQSDTEREMTDPTGMTSMVRQQQDMERVRKVWDETSSATPHLAQLQAMGMNALGLPTAGESRTIVPTSHASSSESSIRRKSNSAQGDLRDKKDTKPASASEGSSSSSRQQQQQQQEAAAVSAEMAMNAHMMSALGGFLPGMDPSFLSYMYPGLPGYFPGMGMPGMMPGLMPGAEQLMTYDPLSFGTPLPLLQIPQDAIKTVSELLTDPKSTLAQYTQDCKSLADLKNQVSSVDFACAHEGTVDVGYICKKCQMVYPAKDACVQHQKTMCFAGSKIPEGVKAMLKLEQKQYECRACVERFSTGYEYKLHCQVEVHKLKATKLYQRKSDGAHSTSTSGKIRHAPSENRHESASDDTEPKLKKPKIV